MIRILKNFATRIFRGIFGFSICDGFIGDDRESSSCEAAWLDGCTDGFIVNIIEYSWRRLCRGFGMVEKDEGFCKVMRRAEQKGMTRRERREEDRRWRKERRRSVPSPSAAFRYLSNFHDGEQGYVGKGLHHLNKIFHDATPIFMICNMGIFSSLSRKDFEPVAMCP